MNPKQIGQIDASKLSFAGRRVKAFGGSALTPGNEDFGRFDGACAFILVGSRRKVSFSPCCPSNDFALVEVQKTPQLQQFRTVIFHRHSSRSVFVSRFSPGDDNEAN